ncbi:hypothetical protein PybrP1_010561 [[Pythium] brassicae (nom. inval.)]|nr:hypothetical protein PybrP1_010561 [[Pythium] brassicae (nom. inval.)]
MKDSGATFPIERVGGVICSDLKGSVTSSDRRGDRYLINFVDHHSGYCRVFVTKPNDQAAKQLENFLAVFEKRFECSIHVLRTEGGAEYWTVDLFYCDTGPAAEILGRRFRVDSVHTQQDAHELDAKVRLAAQGSDRGATEPCHDRWFGIPSMLFEDGRKKNSLKKNTSGVIIAGRGEETKGVKAYIPKERIVIMARRVANLEASQRRGRGATPRYSRRGREGAGGARARASAQPRRAAASNSTAKRSDRPSEPRPI